MFQSMAELRAVSYLTPVVLLVISNTFMTTAWYWHLKFRGMSLFAVILISWSIAFFEYCFAVPANRFGYSVYNAAQLKTIQEVVTLTVFTVFSITYLGESFRWQQLVGFALIAAGAFFIFQGGKAGA